jgi:hypothetical protein
MERKTTPGPKKTYEKPRVTFVKLRPEEMLIACGKLAAHQECFSGQPRTS